MRNSIAFILAPLPLVCGALVMLSACDSEPDSHLVSAPPPSAQPAPVTTTMVTTTTASTPVVVANPQYVTTTQPAYVTTNGAPGVSTVIVTQAPPVPQVDAVIAQPGSQYVWLAGYWTWQNNRYEWRAGHWEQPPTSNSVWTAPRWEQEGNAYRFHEGYWN